MQLTIETPKTRDESFVPAIRNAATTGDGTETEVLSGQTARIEPGQFLFDRGIPVSALND